MHFSEGLLEKGPIGLLRLFPPFPRLLDNLSLFNLSWYEA